MDVKTYLVEEYDNIPINQAFELTNEIKNDICSHFKITTNKLGNLLK